MFVRLVLFCFILFGINAFALPEEPRFEIVDNEENKFVGTLSALDKTEVVFNVQGITRTVSLEKLVNIRNIALNPYSTYSVDTDNPTALPTLSLLDNRNETAFKASQSNDAANINVFPDSVDVLELIDGSLLTVSPITIANNQAAFRFINQPNNLSIPLNALTAVRFSVRSLTEANNPPENWQRLAIPNAEGDRLIVGNANAFDVYSGILRGITTQSISFAVDGEVLPVPRRKVFGIVLHNDSPAEGVTPLAILSLWSGTKAMIADIRLQNNELTWTTASGLTTSMPLEMLEEIDFGEKKVTYLTDLELVRSDFSLPFESELKPPQFPFLQSFYESRSKNVSGGAILDGTYYERSITLKGKTLYEYRLSKPVSVLKAVIGIEDQYRPFSSSVLKILADSQLLGTWELRGNTPSEKIHLKLPQPCRILTVIVEPVPLSNEPTVLTIADPKFVE